MEISQLDLGRMLLCSLLCGGVLAVFYELLQIPLTLLFSELHPLPKRLMEACRVPQALQAPFSLPWRHKKNSKTENRTTQILNWVFLVITDLLFCICAALLLLLTLYATNDGAFRWSSVGVMLVGFWICRRLLTPLISTCLQTAYVVFCAIVRFCVALILYLPLRLVWLAWVKSAVLRARIKARYLQYRKHVEQRKAEKLNKKKDKIEESIIKNKESIRCERPVPDGRRIFYTGKARADTK
jgi:hypothetical protein